MKKKKEVNYATYVQVSIYETMSQVTNLLINNTEESSQGNICGSMKTMPKIYEIFIFLKI